MIAPVPAAAKMTDAPTPPPPVVLSLLEARVLAVLVEKEGTVPDTYPLSVNALLSGCNQKNNRDPVLEASEGEVLAALDGLRPANWVIESSGARVPRYAHNMDRVLRLPRQSVVLLAVLMLRGPQTAAELRQASERLHRFADVSSVEAFLEELAARAAAAGGPLVVKLARAPGSREARWAHLLSGPVQAEAYASHPVAASDEIDRSEIAALRWQQQRMALEIAELRARLDQLVRELGVQI